MFLGRLNRRIVVLGSLIVIADAFTVKCGPRTCKIGDVCHKDLKQNISRCTAAEHCLENCDTECCCCTDEKCLEPKNCKNWPVNIKEKKKLDLTCGDLTLWPYVCSGLNVVGFFPVCLVYSKRGEDLAKACCIGREACKHFNYYEGPRCCCEIEGCNASSDKCYATPGHFGDADTRPKTSWPVSYPTYPTNPTNMHVVSGNAVQIGSWIANVAVLVHIIFSVNLCETIHF